MWVKLFFILGFSSFCLANSKHCKSVMARQEWRTLRDHQKAAFISAVQCLQDLPAIGSFKEAKTRFDDFQGAHISLADEVHLVGQFLPWHRRMLNVYERALRKECGYKGALPYWNWSIDVEKTGSVAASPIFDAVTGFGGNGVDIPGYAGQFGNLSVVPGWNATTQTGGGCIIDGPFASYNLSLGPGTLLTNHCIQRGFNDAFANTISVAQVASTTKLPTFELFRIELEGFPVTPVTKIHDAGHYIVNGEMANVYSSPGDPVFYLHHANLDRIWWLWQEADLAARLFQISGRSSVDPPFSNVTLEFGLKMDFAPVVPIRDVMDIRKAPLCYAYV